MTDELVQQIAKRIVQQFRPEPIMAFGGYARGEHDSDSELDLLVIMQTEKAFAEQTVEVDSIFGLRDGATDMVIYTPEEFNQQQHVWGTLAARLKAEGKILYEQPQ